MSPLEPDQDNPPDDAALSADEPTQAKGPSKESERWLHSLEQNASDTSASGATERVGRDAGRIADETLSHLSALSGAKVKVTMEIEVETPEGAPEHVQRSVSENARVLRFDSYSYEREYAMRSVRERGQKMIGALGLYRVRRGHTHHQVPRFGSGGWREAGRVVGAGARETS